MIKFKKKQQIVYDVTFRHNEKGVKVRFVITKSKITELRKVHDFIRGLVYNTKISDNIYNLYRIDINDDSQRKVLLMTSRLYNLCMNTIKYVLELNKL